MKQKRNPLSAQSASIFPFRHRNEVKCTLFQGSSSGACDASGADNGSGSTNLGGNCSRYGKSHGCGNAQGHGENDGSCGRSIPTEDQFGAASNHGEGGGAGSSDGTGCDY